MWVLNFLPDWLFYGLFFLGLIGILVTYLLRFIPIPSLYIYRTPIQIISIALLAIGTYMSGAIANNEAWQAKVRELEAKVAAAEAESAKENTKIVDRVITKTQIVKSRGESIIRYIDKEVVKYDSTCVIPKEFIKAHNDAAEQPK